LPKKPANGGIPAIEKKIITKVVLSSRFCIAKLFKSVKYVKDLPDFVSRVVRKTIKKS